MVPGSYPAFARVLHRIDPNGQAIRWSRVCAASGAVAHSLMQWWPISRNWSAHSNPPQGRSSWEDPMHGNLDQISMSALYEVLAQFTTAAQVFHGFWTGWGGMHPGSVGAFQMMDRSMTRRLRRFRSRRRLSTGPPWNCPVVDTWCSPALWIRACSATGRVASSGRSRRACLGPMIIPGAWAPK